MDRKTDGDRISNQGHLQRPKALHDRLNEDTGYRASSSSKRRFRPEIVANHVTDWIEKLPIKIRGTPPLLPDPVYTCTEAEPSDQDYLGDGFIAPTVPSSQNTVESPGTRDYVTASETVNSSQLRLVKKFEYRSEHLYKHGINLTYDSEKAIPTVSAVCRAVQRPMSSKATFTGDLEDLRSLQSEGGATESDITSWFLYEIFKPSNGYKLQQNIKPSFKRLYVPGCNDRKHGISMPIPDAVYGYRGRVPTKYFTEAQLLAGAQIGPEMGCVDGRSLSFPFLIVEYKADGGFSVEENKCMGASATCVSMINKLNDKLQEYTDTKTVCNAVFSFIIDQFSAVMYVSWMGPDGKYYMLPIEDFGFSAGPDGLRDLKNRVQRIFDWAAGSRLSEIQRALDIIGEEGRRDNSIASKARDPSPSSDTSSDRPQVRKKRKGMETYWDPDVL